MPSQVAYPDDTQPANHPLPSTRHPTPWSGVTYVRPTYQGRPGFYTIDDISVGGTIDVYGRRFHVVDANGATRRLLEERWRRLEAPAIAFPVDRYTVERKEFMSRQTGCDPNVQHKIIKVRVLCWPEARSTLHIPRRKLVV